MEFYDYQKNIEASYRKQAIDDANKKCIRIEQQYREKLVDCENKMSSALAQVLMLQCLCFYLRQINALREELQLKQKAFESIDSELREKDRYSSKWLHK